MKTIKNPSLIVAIILMTNMMSYTAENTNAKNNAHYMLFLFGGAMVASYKPLYHYSMYNFYNDQIEKSCKMQKLLFQENNRLYDEQRQDLLEICRQYDCPLSEHYESLLRNYDHDAITRLEQFEKKIEQKAFHYRELRKSEFLWHASFVQASLGFCALTAWMWKK
jgi:hypothetical protein